MEESWDGEEDVQSSIPSGDIRRFRCGDIRWYRILYSSSIEVVVIFAD